MSDDQMMFRIRVMASAFVLRAVTVRMMLLDPGFAQDARQWFDTIFGAFSASEHAHASSHEIVSVLREEYLRVLALNEEQARKATSVPKTKSIRRRIFEWFERG
jgi:hypothetical protein